LCVCVCLFSVLAVAHALNNEQTIATELAVQQTMKSVVADVEKPKGIRNLRVFRKFSF